MEVFGIPNSVFHKVILLTVAYQLIHLTPKGVYKVMSGTGINSNSNLYNRLFALIF